MSHEIPAPLLMINRPAQPLQRAQDDARRGNFADARRHCEQALRQTPSSLPALRLHGMILIQLQQWSAAIAVHRRIVDRDPADVESMANLAGLLAERGDMKESISLLQRAVEARPQWPILHFNLANALCTDGCFEAALPSYAAALRLDPKLAAALNNRGSALKRLGRLSEALDSFQSAARAAPHWAIARANLGASLLEQGQYAAAVPELWYACELDAEDADAVAALSRALLQSKSLSEYLRQFRGLGSAAFQSERIWDAVADRYFSSRDWAPAAMIWATVLEQKETALRWSRLGLATLLQGYETHNRAALEVAAAALRRAVALDPALATAQVHLASALKDLGRVEEALAVLAPMEPFAADDMALGAATLLELRAAGWDWTRYDDLLRTMLVAVRDQGKGLPPMGILVRYDDPELQRTATRQYLAGLGITPIARTERARLGNERLRIGYLSSDFREHPVAHALAAVIEAHDRANFDIIGIATTPSSDSPIAARIRAAFDRCIDVSNCAISEQETEIRNLGLDILVDLGGLTIGSNPRLLARRAAPIQAAYLGYAATLGAAGIDYLIADRCVIPAQSIKYYDERIVWLPDTFLPGEMLGLPEISTAARAGEGLPAEAFVFCNFNQPVRLNPESFDVFLKILGRVPNSVLWLRSLDARAESRLRNYAAAGGVDPGRLIFAVRTPGREEHLGRLRLADLFLDTLPYNAHTTGREALAAGLPLLTCAGASFAARVAASLLTSLELRELITGSREEFIQRAVDLAQAPQVLGKIRRRLMAGLPNSAAFNPKMQAHHLELAFAAMAADACAGAGPRRNTQPLDLTRSVEARYQGPTGDFVLPPAWSKGRLLTHPTTSTARNLLWIASYPKSGNTWLRFLICNLLYGTQSSAAALDVLAPDIHEQGARFFPPQRPILLKTHYPVGPRLPFAERTAAAIYVVRDPADVMLSNYHYAQRSTGLGAAQEADLTGYVERYLDAGGDPRWIERGIGGWAENVATWLVPDHPFPVLRIRYEDLLLDGVKAARQLCKFLAISRTPNEIDEAIAGASFERLRAIEETDIASRRIGIFYKPYLESSIAQGRRFMRTGVAGDARKSLSPAQRQRLYETFAAGMKAAGYEITEIS